MKSAAMAALGMALLSAPALAQGSAPQTRTICVDVSGASRPAVCHVSGGKLDAREDICQCPEGRRIQAPVCGEGETPPPETAAFDAARRKAAADGTLVGDLFQGRPMCVAPYKDGA